MENWNNLNNLLTLNSKLVKVQEDESQQLIDLCNQTGDKKEIKDKVKRILKNGANINCFADNSTPLISCIENDQYDLALYLLFVNASMSYKPREDFNDAVWFALKNKKHDFLSLFVDKHCLLNIDYESKQPPLIYATIASDLKSVIILLSHYRIKVNEKDGIGNTALHHNVAKMDPSEDDIEIGRLLLAAGADINTTNLEGQTPEQAAVTQHSKAVLLSGKLERELVQPTPEEDNEPTPTLPNPKKLKI